jgi:hypothetical protein
MSIGEGKLRARRVAAEAHVRRITYVAPDVFMSDFERTEWGDKQYAVVGRALAFASRFERNAKSLSALVNIRNNPTLLESDEEIDHFFSHIYKTPLANHLTVIGLDQGIAGKIVTNARFARNELIHELSLGMDRCLDLLPKTAIDEILENTRRLVTIIAKGDAIVCFLASVATSELTPTREFFDDYPNKIAAWTCNV